MSRQKEEAVRKFQKWILPHPYISNDQEDSGIKNFKGYRNLHEGDDQEPEAIWSTADPVSPRDGLLSLTTPQHSGGLATLSGCSNFFLFWDFIFIILIIELERRERRVYETQRLRLDSDKWCKHGRLPGWRQFLSL